MKRIFLASCMALSFMACSSDEKSTMVINGEIKGLKKGTVYLQKLQDTLLVPVDSVSLDGISTFSLSSDLESPEIYYLSLGDDKDKRIEFFGDQGEITITTKLDKFVLSAEIKGQRNQQLLGQYTEMMKKYQDKNLDLIKADFESKNDSLKRDSILKISNNLLKSRYLYTTNFAVKNADAEIAPYLALTQLYNANIALLDTVNNSLSKEVKASKYGKELEKFIADIKSKE